MNYVEILSLKKNLLKLVKANGIYFIKKTSFLCNF